MGRRAKGFNTPFADIAQQVVPVEARPPEPPVSAPPEPPEDPEALFERAMTGVQPLGDKPTRVEPQKTQASGQPDDEALALVEFQSFARGEGRFDLNDTGDVVWGKAPGVQSRTVDDLKRGRFAFRRHLDLHGYNREEARAELQGFVSTARRDGESCVLVVTGRGRGSPDGLGVLRQALPRWLSRSPLNNHVLAFCTARRLDGGPGAFYILLRRAGRGPFGGGG